MPLLVSCLCVCAFNFNAPQWEKSGDRAATIRTIRTYGESQASESDDTKRNWQATHTMAAMHVLGDGCTERINAKEIEENN